MESLPEWPLQRFQTFSYITFLYLFKSCNPINLCVPIIYKALCLYAETKKQKKTCSLSPGSLEVSILLSLPHSILEMAEGYTASIHFYESMYLTCAPNVKTWLYTNTLRVFPELVSFLIHDSKTTSLTAILVLFPLIKFLTKHGRHNFSHDSPFSCHPTSLKTKIRFKVFLH